MCIGRVWVVTIHDWLVTYPDNAERFSRIMEQAFGSVSIKPSIKVTAFDLKAPGSPLGQSRLLGGQIKVSLYFD